MMKKSIPQHKRMAMGGGHTPLGYARGGMVASSMPAPARPAAFARPTAPASEVAKPVPTPIRSTPIRPGAQLGNAVDTVRPSMTRSMPAPIRPGPAMSSTPDTVGPMTAGGVKSPTVAMKSGGGVKVSAGVSANAVKNPLRTARTNNGVVGMKDGGKAGKKC